MWSEAIVLIPETGNQYKYWCKHYDESSSEFGLQGGRISKLTIRKVGDTRDLYNYDRGIDLPAANAEVEAVLQIAIAKYN